MSAATQLFTALEAQFGDLLTITPTGIGETNAKFYTVTITTDPSGQLQLHLLGHSRLQDAAYTAALTDLAAQHGATIQRYPIDQSQVNQFISDAQKRRTSLTVTTNASPEGTATTAPKPSRSKRKATAK